MAIFRALTHRSFVQLWSGQSISRLGDSFYTIALTWWVLQKYGSATAMGEVLICSTLPMILCLLFGGVAVDRSLSLPANARTLANFYIERSLWNC